MIRALLLVSFLCTAINANEPPDPEFWNRWQTENFVILSYDQKQGEYLSKNIEKMKGWVFARWGLPDVEFSGECKIACVPTKDLMKELYRLDHSAVFTKRKPDGGIESTTILLILDRSPASVIPIGLTEVCLNELCSRNIKIRFWAHRGMAVLNGTLSQIRQELGPLENRSISSRRLFSMTEGEWRSLPKDQQRLFDQQAAATCLLLRKEFGQSKFLTFILTDNKEEDLKEIFGFSSEGNFDKALARYITNLSEDLNNGKTPDSYLQITASK